MKLYKTSNYYFFDSEEERDNYMQEKRDSPDWDITRDSNCQFIAYTDDDYTKVICSPLSLNLSIDKEVLLKEEE